MTATKSAVEYCVFHEKRTYTKRGAEEQRNWLRQNGKARELRIYECPSCGGWHLTKRGTGR